MTRRPLLISGLVLGIGLGGFFDGIVLHQLLQWHHLTSSIYPMDTVEGLQINTLWDGIFHSAMYLLTALGLILMWRATRREEVPYAPGALFGAILMGAGGFNVFDSIVNHWILGVHHIRSGPDELLYDLAFFAIGLALIGVGLVIYRRRPSLATAR